MAIPMATSTAKSLGKGAGWSFTTIIRTIWKYKYWFLILIFLLPTIISSIQTAISTQNPTYPLIQFGLAVTNSDTLLNNDISMLRDNPQEMIGMDKPTEGIFQKMKYYWKLFLVGWNIAGYLILITLPFRVFYMLFRSIGSKGLQSSKSADIMKALIWGFGLMFVVNLVLLGYAGFSGNTDFLNLDSADVFTGTWQYVVYAIPFHGVLNLIMFLAGF